MRAAVFFAKLLRKFFCPEYLELLNLPPPVGAHPEALSREPPAPHGRVQTATGRAPTGGGIGTEVGALRGGAEGRPQDGDAEGMRAAEAREDGMVRRMDRSGRMMAEKENAPKVGSQAGAAIKSTDDSTTFADDARFAARALGAGELLAPLSELRDPRTLLAFLGAWLVIVGMFLTLALIG